MVHHIQYDSAKSLRASGLIK